MSLIFRIKSLIIRFIDYGYYRFDKIKDRKTKNRAAKVNREEESRRMAMLQKKYNHLQPGISVVVATHKGEEVIDRCLESLAKQTLDRSLFEVIFVINGEKDQTDQKIKKVFEKEITLDYSIHYLEEGSVGLARNLGFESAKKSFVCLLDDDDYFSDNFLEETLKACRHDRIVFSQIVDVDEKGVLNPNNSINLELIKNRRVRATEMLRIRRGITMSGGKIFPAYLVKEHKFRKELTSGEDIAFFSTLFMDWDLSFRVVHPRKKVIYYRLLRSNSISRKKLSYQFNVTERLAVISHLDKKLSEVKEPHRIEFLNRRILAQAEFITIFLEQFINLREKVYEDIIRMKIVNFPFSIFNNNKANKLVVSYCFPPYVDTSGTVVAKRIRADRELVDVILNKMDTRRKVNPILSLIANQFIDKRFELKTFTTFSRWDGMEAFVVQGLKKIQHQVRRKGHYDKVYSRALWPASHLLSFEYKVKNRKVEWSAEFSDPLMYDIHGKERPAKIASKKFLRRYRHELEKAKLPVPESKNLFFWCEYLPYAFADRLIFTNENQRQYMLDRFPVKEVIPEVMKKSIVKPQPVLPEVFYHIHPSEYPIDKKYVNMAYFGLFYATRKLEELVEAVESLQQDERKQLRIHIFTDKPEEFQNEIRGTPIEEVFRVGPYVSYFEFLNLSTKFDVLIVNDARTRHVKEINPYLPSKISDYTGSGTAIWGLYEEGSILSKLEIQYKSPIGDVKATRDMLLKILEKAVVEKRARLRH
jgi:glycosyltransferase involved in cell wall biosynthesis